MEATMTMTGYLGTDVEFRGEREDGRKAYATFRLACTPRARGRDGEWRDEPTTWLSVACFTPLAENVASSFRKGEPVIVIGRLRTKSWVDQETGEVKERLELRADRVGHDLKLGTAAFRKRVRQPEDRHEAAAELGADSAPSELHQQEEQEIREVTAA